MKMMILRSILLQICSRAALLAKGKLPVTVCETLKYGYGIVKSSVAPAPCLLILASMWKNYRRSILWSKMPLKRRAIPGGVVLVAKDGKIAYERAFGYMGYDKSEPVYPETIYDLPPMTKIMATTISVMKLYDEGKLDLTENTWRLSSLDAGNK